MPPTLESMGFTLSGPTAATRHGTNRRSIRGPITTALAAWHQERRPLGWPARIRCHSTTYSRASYCRRTPEVAEATEVACYLPRRWSRQGLKVVCSPDSNFRSRLHPAKLISPIGQLGLIGNFYSRVQPAQGPSTPRALPAHRRLNRYPSPGLIRGSHARSYELYKAQSKAYWYDPDELFEDRYSYSGDQWSATLKYLAPLNCELAASFYRESRLYSQRPAYDLAGVLTGGSTTETRHTARLGLARAFYLDSTLFQEIALELEWLYRAVASNDAFYDADAHAYSAGIQFGF